MPLSFNKCLLVANDYSGPMPKSVDDWVERAGFNQYAKCHFKAPLPVARNRAVRDVVYPWLERTPDAEWVFFIDNDVEIVEEGLGEFLSLDSDIVACECPMPDQAWGRPDLMHNAFWRIKAEAVGRVPLPWFEFITSPDGCEVIGCDCLYFSNKARNEGLSIIHGGWCEHGNAGTWRGHG